MVNSECGLASIYTNMSMCIHSIFKQGTAGEKAYECMRKK
jgi:hypothetical protein